MSLEKIQLRKLLKFFYLDRSELVGALRNDIREEISRKPDEESGGGDFFGPFWGDAKKFAANEIDLHAATAERIESNRLRRRLYPLLQDGFLNWWNEKRRWRNEAFTIAERSPSGLFPIEEIGLTVRVENLLALHIEGGSNRAIYPYFSETPALSREAARLGLWVLNETISDYEVEDLRMLDILRSTSYGVTDCPFEGNERELFIRKYNHIKSEWDRLRREYPDD
ncbi:MAG: hypothetical protein Q7T44_06125 [Parvibaculum sp.]|nr:hypothetical protein [Parvibaculum sp.]